MKYTLISECERCGKKEVFEADTNEKSEGGASYNKRVSEVAIVFCGMTYVHGLERIVCEDCKACWEELMAASKSLKDSFRANQITHIQDADWG